MTTHRFLQIHSLLDTLESKARVYDRCAKNAARIRNDRAAGHYLRKQVRVSTLAAKCRSRMDVAK